MGFHALLCSPDTHAHAQRYRYLGDPLAPTPVYTHRKATFHSHGQEEACHLLAMARGSPSLGFRILPPRLRCCVWGCGSKFKPIVVFNHWCVSHSIRGPSTPQRCICTGYLFGVLTGQTNYDSIGAACKSIIIIQHPMRLCQRCAADPTSRPTMLKMLYIHMHFPLTSVFKLHEIILQSHITVDHVQLPSRLLHAHSAAFAAAFALCHRRRFAAANHRALHSRWAAQHHNRIKTSQLARASAREVPSPQPSQLPSYALN